MSIDSMVLKKTVQSVRTARQSAFLEALGTVLTLAIFLLPAVCLTA